MGAHCLVATQMESSEFGELVVTRNIHHDYLQTHFFDSNLRRNLLNLNPLQVSVFRFFFRVLLGLNTALNPIYWRAK